MGLSKSKRLFVLKESEAEFKPALLGDLEYITFTSPGIEATYMPILEGLRELGFLDFEG